MIFVWEYTQGFRVCQADTRPVESREFKNSCTRRVSYQSLDDALAAETHQGIREALFRIEASRLSAYLAKPEKAAEKAAYAAKRAKRQRKATAERKARQARQGGWCKDFVISPRKQDGGDS